MPNKKKVGKKKKPKLIDESVESSDAEQFSDLDDSESEHYVPQSDNDNEDDTFEDNNEIEDEDEVDDVEEDVDKCLYKYSKNKEADSDDEYMEDIENIDDVKEIYLTGDDRITDDIMSDYEFVRIIGTRAKQISLGCKKFIKGVDHLSSKEIALLELKHKLIPYKIKRPLPNNTYEIWEIQELETPFLTSG